jgi:hypothetical protein
MVMLTNKQKAILENKIYSIAKKYFTEAKEKKSDTEMSQQEKESILNWVADDSINQADVAYEIYGSEGEAEEAADRSLFYKKLHGKKNDNGVEYSFSNQELNSIKAALNKGSNQ